MRQPKKKGSAARSLVELVYVDIKTKMVTGYKPTPAFRALYGVGINSGPDTPLKLEFHEVKLTNIVGLGGDGGGLNAHNSTSLLISNHL